MGVQGTQVWVWVHKCPALQETRCAMAMPPYLSLSPQSLYPHSYQKKRNSNSIVGTQDGAINTQNRNCSQHRKVGSSLPLKCVDVCKFGCMIRLLFLLWLVYNTTKLACMVIKLETKMSENVMKSFYNLKKKTSLMILKELR